jgi:hypothetical protein
LNGCENKKTTTQLEKKTEPRKIISKHAQQAKPKVVCLAAYGLTKQYVFQIKAQHRYPNQVDPNQAHPSRNSSSTQKNMFRSLHTQPPKKTSLQIPVQKRAYKEIVSFTKDA